MSLFTVWSWLSQLWHIGLAGGLLIGAAYLAFGVNFPFHKAAATTCACVALFIFGQAAGDRTATARCQEASVRATLAQREARIAELLRQAKEGAEIADRARERADFAERATEAAIKRANDYELALSKIPKDRRCTLSDTDLRGLR